MENMEMQNGYKLTLNSSEFKGSNSSILKSMNDVMLKIDSGEIDFYVLGTTPEGEPIFFDRNGEAVKDFERAKAWDEIDNEVPAFFHKLYINSILPTNESK